MPDPAYIVITPVRDEEKYLPLTLSSMYAQTVKPRQWILVNDGSIDGTRRLIDQAAATHPWIIALHRADRGSRQAGSGVIAAFYDGFNMVAGNIWDYVVKFDGDLSFAPDYFELCLREFAADKTLGIAGGTCSKFLQGKTVPEFDGEPPFHVRGPTKIYCRECFEAIGGLIQAPGWDTVDLIKANMLGWKTRTFPNIQIIHHRPTGGAYGSWANYVKNGLANYITGYHPVFMACKCARRMLHNLNSEGLGLWCGFMKGYLQRIPRISDPAMICYLRRQQWRALTFRKNIWG
jgi:glycosyltransferase involved in cell wall biosynthesis